MQQIWRSFSRATRDRLHPFGVGEAGDAVVARYNLADLKTTGEHLSGNGRLGIDLSPGGRTANDPQDANSSANDLQNYPVLTSAFKSDVIGEPLIVNGTRNSTRSTTLRLEFFVAGAWDPTVEADRFEGSTSTATSPLNSQPSRRYPREPRRRR